MKINRGFHNSVEGRIARVHAHRSGKPFQGAFLSRVLSGDGDSERVKIASMVGENTTSFAYPFASRNAWIRGQPEATTTMISIIGSDTNDLQAIGYFDPEKSNAAKRHRNTVAAARQQPSEPIPTRVLPYRSLAPGELDIGSQFSQTFMGKQDVHQSRGGLSHWVLSSKSAQLETPLFEIHGHAHQLTSAGDLNDEIRYGTVRRAKTSPSITGEAVSSPTRPSLISVAGVVNTRSQTAPTFAKEFAVLVNWLGDPNRLIDHRQGVVVEDNGTLAHSSQTSKRLRARMRWFTRGGGETKTEIDELGNAIFLTSDKASEGVVIGVPAGSMKIKIGGQSAQGSGGKFSLQTTNDASFSADGVFRIVTKSDLGIKATGRGEISIARGITMKSDGVINIDAKPRSGISLGDREKDKYPVLVAHPKYVSSLNNVWGAVTGLSGTLATYGSSAAGAWAAIGPLMNLIDPSGTVMGMCLAAGASAGQVAAAAPQASAAIGQHLPTMGQMPQGFLSSKVVSE